MRRLLCAFCSKHSVLVPVRLLTLSTLEEEVTQLLVPADRHASRQVPRVINGDKNAASPKAISEIKASGDLPASVELRQVNYLNTLVEQDHRFLKCLVKPGMGFFSFKTAWRTRAGDMR